MHTLSKSKSRAFPKNNNPQKEVPPTRFVIPKTDATVNEPPPNCIMIYQVAFNYDVRFPLHPMIMEILRKFELAPVQIVSTS